MRLQNLKRKQQMLFQSNKFLNKECSLFITPWELDKLSKTISDIVLISISMLLCGLFQIGYIHNPVLVQSLNSKGVEMEGVCKSDYAFTEFQHCHHHQHQEIIKCYWIDETNLWKSFIIHQNRQNEMTSQNQLSQKIYHFVPYALLWNDVC